MSKKLLTLALVIGFTLTSVGISYAKFKCTVESIDGGNLVLKDCNEKKAGKLKVGDKVSITKKRKGGMEGC